MTYVKVDDGFVEHPKAIDLSLAAVGLWLHGLCYCGRQHSDGFIPTGVIRRAGGDETLVAELVGAGLWDTVDGGWQIHDYTDWQRSAAEIDELSAKRAEAGRRGGQAKAKQVASNLPSKRLANAKQNESKPLAYTDPDPDPDPERTALQGTSVNGVARSANGHAPTARSDDRDSPFALFAAICDAAGLDPRAYLKPDKDKHIATCQWMLKQGVTEADARGCVGWLRSQSWRTTPVDAMTVKKEIGTWMAAGRPAKAQEMKRSVSQADLNRGGTGKFVP